MMSSIQLNFDQTERLKEAVFADLPNPGPMGQILESLAKPRRYAEFSTPSATHPETLLRIIKESATEGWLIELIDEILESIPDDVLKSLRSELRPQAHRTAADPFVACRLSGANVLVDRTDLRSHARSLVAMDGKRMLIVKGKRRTGKTHTAQFIAYLQQVHRGFSLLRIDLAAFNRVTGVALQAVTATAPIQ